MASLRDVAEAARATRGTVPDPDATASTSAARATRGTVPDPDATASTSAARRGEVFASANAAVVAREVREQKQRRQKVQPRGRIHEDDLKKGVLETRATLFNARQNESKAKVSWRKALSGVQGVKQAASGIADVNPLEWVDVDGLFAYYDAVYFGNKLSGRVTFSWHTSSVGGGDDEDEQKGDESQMTRVDSMFKYCLCSDVPKWWHGSDPKQLCVGVCCVVERRAAMYSRVAHLRMPDVLRRFKMTQMTKEALLHGMTHAFLFVNGHTRENAAFNVHDEEFKRVIHKINYDFITSDAYRPPDKGYQIRWFDRETSSALGASLAESGENDPTARLHERDAGMDAQTLQSKLFKDSLVDVLTPEHYKLLYIISKHSHLAEKATDKERWVRYLHLSVLVYEAIIAGVLSYDYAPCGQQIGSKRLTLNISQEARDNLDDLVETGMVRSLRMTTESGFGAMAYQPSRKGLERLRSGSISKDDVAMVDAFLYDPKGALLRVRYDADAETFKLFSDEGFNVDSAITEAEDVSYVCSPYICRQFMANTTNKLSSNAYRATESLRGISSIMDELDVQVSLSRVILLVVDWIPTSCTQIMELSQSLGVADRNKGGYYSTEIDRASTDTCLEVPAGLTRVGIIDVNPAQFINMEAEVEYPEAPGITQLESFGLRYSRQGDLICGVKVESVMTKILNDIPCDFLSRVVADVQIDSGTLTSSLMSLYQKNLLETVYDGGGDVSARQKFVLYLAETVTPKLSAAHYLDGDSIESELRQLVGDTHYALDVTDRDVIIFGSDGILFAGPECARHEPLLAAYCALRSRENFVLALYGKLSAMKVSLRKLQAILERIYDEPNLLQSAHMRLAEFNTQVCRLGEAIRHLDLASATPIIQFGDAREPETPVSSTTAYYSLDAKSSRRLKHAMAIEELEASVAARIGGCAKHLKANEEFLRTLEKQAKEVTRDNRVRTVAATRAALDEAQGCMERASDARTHRLLIGIYTGLFAFRLFDRLVGKNWTIPESVAFVTNNIRYPLIWDMNLPWIIMSAGFWVAFVVAIVTIGNVLADREEGFLDSTTTTRRKLCVNTLVRYLKLKDNVGQQTILASDTGQSGTQLTRITYSESPRIGIFDAHRAKVTLTIDSKHGYLLQTKICISKSKSIPASLFPSDLEPILIADLELNRVLTDGATIEKLRKRERKSNAICLRVRSAAEAGTREVFINEFTMQHLKERIASKFFYRVKNVMRISAVQQVDAHTVDEDVIQTDADVLTLRDFQRINVVFYGRPKPKMAKYIQSMRERAERKRVVDERRKSFSKKLRNLKQTLTVEEVYPESDDEMRDEGY